MSAGLCLEEESRLPVQTTTVMEEVIKKKNVQQTVNICCLSLSTLCSALVFELCVMNNVTIS